MRIFQKNTCALRKMFAHIKITICLKDALPIGKRGLYVLTMPNQSGEEKER